MIFTSKYISLTAPTTGRVKRGFFTLGEAAQKKLYAVEYVPSLPGEWGLFFTLLSLAHAAVGIAPICPEMGHSATVCSGHHCTIDTAQISHRVAVWAASASGSLRPVRPQSQNLLKPYGNVNYGLKGQQGTRERKLL